MRVSVLGHAVAVAAVAALHGGALAAQQGAATDTAAVVAAVHGYHDGLREGQPERVRAVLGPSFTMFGGNHSGDPQLWQAHMHLEGAALDAWPRAFVPGAGPHENVLRVTRVHVRGNAALVVARETGRNKFRTWNDELVTYLLGRHAGRWRLVGYFIRDIANPEP